MFIRHFRNYVHIISNKYLHIIFKNMCTPFSKICTRHFQQYLYITLKSKCTLLSTICTHNCKHICIYFSKICTQHFQKYLHAISKNTSCWTNPFRKMLFLTVRGRVYAPLQSGGTMQLKLGSVPPPAPTEFNMGIWPWYQKRFSNREGRVVHKPFRCSIHQ